MDLGLPGTDGLAAVVEIREHVPAAGMPVIMVSAYDRLEYRAEAISVGYSGCVTDPAALLRTINLLLRQGDVEGGTPV